MSFVKDRRSEGVVDVQFQNFLKTEASKLEFQDLIYRLTDICWDICIDKPNVRLGAKVETCLINCVKRFIDTTSYISNRLKRITKKTA